MTRLTHIGRWLLEFTVFALFIASLWLVDVELAAYFDKLPGAQP